MKKKFLLCVMAVFALMVCASFASASVCTACGQPACCTQVKCECCGVYHPLLHPIKTTEALLERVGDNIKCRRAAREACKCCAPACCVAPAPCAPACCAAPAPKCCAPACCEKEECCHRLVFRHRCREKCACAK